MARITKILFENYKSLSGSNTIEMGSAVTLFIGKNNSGKSSVLDVIESVYDFDQYLEIEKLIGSLSLAFLLDDEHIRNGFQENTSGGDVGGNHYAYGKRYIGQEILCNCNINIDSYNKSKTRQMLFVKGQFDGKAQVEWQRVAQSYTKYGNQYACRRINAERDILPEAETDRIELSPTGEGATNLIRLFINNSQYDEELVESILLNELNTIMRPETNYESIKIQQVGDEKDSLRWEIFLTENDGKRYALSKCGSGLKTILLVLINLFLIPNIKGYQDKKILYLFEELENNLHPFLQRKLFEYLLQFAQKTDNQVVLTSHSHVAINCFYEVSEASLYHVIKEGSSSIKEIENYIDKVNILNDLDVKASDLLQSNGIIWVEGPSDRIYLEHWLQLFCDNKFYEGVDYQYLYYGGRLLSHYTAGDKQIDSLINILTTNRNAAIIIDSDKQKNNGRINATKRRIQQEFRDKKLFCWVTKGKEIENYIPTEALMKKYNSHRIKPVEQYEVLTERVKRLERKQTLQKVDFAQDICKYITKENTLDVLDLKKQIEKLYRIIKEWNK